MDFALGLERRGPVRLISFDFQGNRYDIVDLQEQGALASAETAELRSSLEIRDGSGKRHGYIKGVFGTDENRGVRFRSDDIGHTGVKAYFRRIVKGEEHVSGLVRESIAQLLDQDAVSTWESSSTLLEGARKMYDALLEDQRLDGRKILLPGPDPYTRGQRFRYLLRRR